MSESPGERAAKRAEELHKRLQELQAGVPETKEFAEQAARRAMEARERTAQAFRRAARLHFDRAEILEGAAEAHESEVSAGVGDAEMHRRAAEEFRERARQHRAAAEKDLLREADEAPRPFASGVAPENQGAFAWCYGLCRCRFMRPVAFVELVVSASRGWPGHGRVE